MPASYSGFSPWLSASQSPGSIRLVQFLDLNQGIVRKNRIAYSPYLHHNLRLFCVKLSIDTKRYKVFGVVTNIKEMNG